MSHHTSTKRWQLVPDEDDSRRELWVWNPDAEDDLDGLFERVAEYEGTEDDHELFYAALLDRFVTRTFSGEQLEPWVAKALAEQFYKILSGGDVSQELPLPGRPVKRDRPWREERDLSIACYIANKALLGEERVTHAIQEAADEYAVSFQLARKAYYKWLPVFQRDVSKNAPDS